MKKVLSITLMVVMMLTVASNIALATTVALDPSTITGTTGTGTTSVQNLGKQILGIVQTVGSIAAVIVLVVLGIKYMMGSTEEKAEYKKTLIPYIIGAVLIFAASNVAGFIYDWAITIQ